MPYETVKSIVVFLALATAVGVFGWRCYERLWLYMRRGKSTGPFKNWGERLRGLGVFVAGQYRLFRVPLPGVAHFFMFWGFLVLSLTILQAIVEGLLAFTAPRFVIPWVGSFGPLALSQDLLAVLVAVAVTYGLYVRLIVDPERYKGSHKSQGVMVLGFVMAIMISLLVMNGINMNLGVGTAAAWRPVSRFVGDLFASLPPSSQFVVGEVAYWIHLGVVLLFLTELPEGKHFHVVTSIPSVLLRDLNTASRLPGEGSPVGTSGVATVEGFRWREMLDFYTCTECGRCQDVCPAFASSQTLSPKLMIMALRANLEARGAAFRVNGDKPESAKILDQKLVGDVLQPEVLWSCTTCLACDQECPLFIQHVLPIVEMRRHLVLEGEMDELLQAALDNLGRYGNSFGQSERARAKWTTGVEGGVKDARKEPIQYLWFVGDYASYNPIALQKTQTTARVFNKLGLDYGILYESERNAGNDVRRTGEEGLYEVLMEDNLAALERVDCAAIVTTDPHSYNTLKNEYTFTNGRPHIVHYTELIDNILTAGDLRFSEKLDRTVAFHDPCYLGRYNNIYDAPRRIIEATGCKLKEMRNHHDRATCCGAGGGRIWMDEGDVKERPSETRIREAMDVPGIQDLAVACPKDISMFEDAAKTTGFDDQLQVTDLIELVEAAL
jgi:Fe-S oxidoreductase